MMLLRLPTELQVLVYENATRGSLATLSRTCSHIRLLVKPILYRNVVLDDWRIRPAPKRYRPMLLTWTSYFLFENIAFRVRPFWWDLITSIEIDGQGSHIAWHNLRLLLPRLCNLLHLRINSLMCAEDDPHGTFLSNLAPSIREFSSATTAVTVPFIYFLRDHPDLMVWRYGFSGPRPPLRLPEPPIPKPILARFTQYEVMIDDPPRFAINLRGMTNLTHLSIRLHKVYRSTTIEELSEAIEICGRNLAFFAFDGHIPSVWLEEQGQRPSSSFNWLLTNFVSRMPVLRHLQVKDWAEHPRLTSHTAACIPATLHTLRLRNSFTHEVAIHRGFLKRAFETVGILSPFMPSVITFIHHRYTLFRTNDGTWKVNTSAGDTWTPDWGLESSYFS